MVVSGFLKSCNPPGQALNWGHTTIFVCHVVNARKWWDNCWLQVVGVHLKAHLHQHRILMHFSTQCNLLQSSTLLEHSKACTTNQHHSGNDNIDHVRCWWQICFYFIAPHRFKALDLDFMEELSHHVTIAPICSKADAMTAAERIAFQQHISSQLQERASLLWASLGSDLRKRVWLLVQFRGHVRSGHIKKVIYQAKHMHAALEQERQHLCFVLICVPYMFETRANLRACLILAPWHTSSLHHVFMHCNIWLEAEVQMHHWLFLLIGF